jgi:hypothetical protein
MDSRLRDLRTSWPTRRSFGFMRLSEASVKRIRNSIEGREN